MVPTKDTANPLRVTLICQGFDQSNLKLQPWRRVYEISRRIASNGVSVTILTNGNGQISGESAGKLEIIRVPNLAFSPFLRSGELKKLILATNPSVVVWYGTPFSAFYITRFKSLGKPLIWDIDTDVYDFRVLSKIPLREILNPINCLYTYFATAMLSRFVLRVAGNSPFINGIVVPNLHLKNVLNKKGISGDKLTIIRSTIEKEKICLPETYIQKKLRRIIGFEPDDFLVTYFGSPNPLRGPDIVISSMPKILRKNKKVKLLILSRRVIGDINAEEKYNRIEEEYLEKLVNQKRLNNHVKIIPGFMEKEALKQYLQISDVIVFPFRLVPSEPPLSVFEAMALGKAVITSNIGCLREITESERGLSIKSGSPDELARAILFLSENPQKLLDISKNAKIFACTLPDWNLISNQFSQLLLEIGKKL